MSPSEKIAEVAAEQRIWEAAYAAAFVEDFRTTHNHTGSFDRAVAHTSAETAMTLADLAVVRYRSWRDEECKEQPLAERIEKLQFEDWMELA
jgi:hypothetical protein